MFRCRSFEMVFDAVREYILDNISYDGDADDTDYDNHEFDGRDNEDFEWDDVEDRVNELLEEIGGNDD